MKKILVAAVSLLVSMTLCQAQSFKAGLHGGYTAGGDVEDKGFAYGAQGEVMFNDLFSVELAGTGFTDSGDGADLKVKSFGLTAKCGMKPCKKSRVYGGAGLDYNMFDASSNTALISDVDMDNKVGFHFCAGIEVGLADNVELFGEYRYTFVKLAGDVTVNEGLGLGSMVVPVDEDYNFGVIKIGVNFLF